MKHLIRNKRKIYLCKKVEQNDREIYQEPVEYKINYQPLSTDGEIIVAGIEYTNRLAIYTSPKIAKEFHNHDRCFVFREIPEQYDKTCSAADFFVDGEPMIFLNEARIYLQRMIGEDYERPEPSI